jgi:hypothetical protein
MAEEVMVTTPVLNGALSRYVNSWHRFTVDEYHRLIELGFLTENDRLELLDGYLIDKMPHNPPHDGTVTRIQRRLTRLLPDELLIRVQCAITTKESEPEPDLVVVGGPEDAWDERYPGPQDILLLVEVADSTLDLDRELKLPAYAQARIALYWIVNIVERQIEEYTNPRGDRTPLYRQKRIFSLGDAIPLVLGEEDYGSIRVRDLLPK